MSVVLNQHDFRSGPELEHADDWQKAARSDQVFDEYVPDTTPLDDDAKSSTVMRQLDTIDREIDFRSEAGNAADALNPIKGTIGGMDAGKSNVSFEQSRPCPSVEPSEGHRP